MSTSPDQHTSEQTASSGNTTHGQSPSAGGVGVATSVTTDEGGYSNHVDLSSWVATRQAIGAQICNTVAINAGDTYNERGGRGSYARIYSDSLRHVARLTGMRNALDARNLDDVDYTLTCYTFTWELSQRLESQAAAGRFIAALPRDIRAPASDLMARFEESQNQRSSEQGQASQGDDDDAATVIGSDHGSNDSESDTATLAEDSDRDW